MPDRFEITDDPTLSISKKAGLTNPERFSAGYASGSIRMAPSGVTATR